MFSEVRFRRYFDSPLIGMAINEPDGRWIEVNDRLCGYFGYTREELLQKNWLELTWPEDRDGEAGRYNLAIHAHRPEEQIREKRFLRKDGSVLHVRLFTMYILRDDGLLACLLSLVQDITEQKRTEERLNHAQKVESLGLLAGGIAHDFGNLLAAARGHLGLALATLQDHSEVVSHLEKLDETLARASGLSRKLLVYAGQGDAEVDILDLNHLVLDLVHVLEVSLPAHVRIHFEASKIPAWVEGDSAQLLQVVLNLVTNASESLGNKPGIISINLAVEGECDIEHFHFCSTRDPCPNPHVTLEVSDSGCGISQEALSKVFDPFFTTKGDKRGLGLSAVLGILKAHKAAIGIKSFINEGTTFRIVFPSVNNAGMRDETLPGE